MHIEDEELREVFKTASEEHIQKLDEGFLYLEKHPNDLAKLEELLRETHSLKGDAGMLGIKDVATLSHQLEHLLGGIKRQEILMSADLSDRLAQGLNAIRLLANEAVTGEPSGVNTFYILANLMGAEKPPIESAPAVNEEKAIDTVADESTAASPAIDGAIPPISTEKEEVEIVTPPSEKRAVEIPSLTSDKKEPEILATTNEPLATTNEALTIANYQLPLTKESSYRIETIRVATKNLDILMTQTGELTVSKTRLVHRQAEVEEIVSLWEDWSRDFFLNRNTWENLAKSKNSDLNGQGRQIESLYHRAEDRLEKLGILINNLRNNIGEDTARLNIISDELEEGIRTLRLLPLATIFNLFPRLVRDLARQQSKDVELIIEGAQTEADKQILEKMKDPLMHMIRNAIDHGIETPEERQKNGKHRTAKIKLKGYSTSSNIIIEVTDDGRGLDLEAIKRTAIARHLVTEEALTNMTKNQIESLIFAPGFSTRNVVTEISGRGVGMDIVRANVEALKGTINVVSEAGKGCTFRLQLATSLATAHVLLISVQGMTYALPAEFVQTTRIISESDVFTIEGKRVIAFDQQPIAVVKLAELLDLPDTIDISNNAINAMSENLRDTSMYCLIIKVGNEQLGMFVDNLLDTQDVVLKPQSKLLKRVRNISGATILGSGEVCMVLNPQDLLKSMRKVSGHNPQVPLAPLSTRLGANGRNGQTEIHTDKKQQVILLAEDSIAVRTQEKRILESAGYEVVVAVDGLDALQKLKTRKFDALISDVQMPNLDGLGLTEKIRQQPEHRELPIILVTSLASDEDKKRGAQAGANAYIPKGTFNQQTLLEALRRLV